MKRSVFGIVAVCGMVALVIGVGRPSGAEEKRSKRQPVPRAEKIHGMTVSCPTNGREWGTDDMVKTMRELKALGVEWVSIHPYAQIRRDGSLVPYYGRRNGGKVPTYVTRPIREAHALGMKLMMKPHISYWGSFDWRGAIRFESEEQWQRFFADYERWINDLAEACRDADAFVVGTELEGTTHREKEWRKIVAGVRSRYPGPLTYASNWSEVHLVPFWDAVDVVGVQAYYPVIDGRADAAGSEALDDAVFRDGWQRILGRVRALSQKTGKNVVFTELGYDCALIAPFEPWRADANVRRSSPDHARAERRQRACLDAALTAIENEPTVHGAFLWKWFPGRRQPRDFNKQSEAMRKVIRDRWNGQKVR